MAFEQSGRFDQGSFQPSSMTKSVLFCIVLLITLWLATILSEPLRVFVKAELLLTPDALSNLRLWAPLSHALWPTNFLSCALNCAMLYLFGSTLEHHFGRLKWWTMIFASIILGGSLALLAMWPFAHTAFGAKMPALGGFSAPSAALIAAYCQRHWDHTLHISSLELKGKVLFWLFLIIEATLALLTLHPGMLMWRLGGVGVGFAWSGGRLYPGDLIKRIQYWRIKRKLKLISRTPESDKNTKGKNKDGSWIN